MAINTIYAARTVGNCDQTEFKQLYDCPTVKQSSISTIHSNTKAFNKIEVEISVLQVLTSLEENRALRVRRWDSATDLSGANYNGEGIHETKEPYTWFQSSLEFVGWYQRRFIYNSLNAQTLNLEYSSFLQERRKPDKMLTQLEDL